MNPDDKTQAKTRGKQIDISQSSNHKRINSSIESNGTKNYDINKMTGNSSNSSKGNKED